MKIGVMNNPANNLIDEINFAGENKFDFIDLTIEPPKAQIKDIDLNKTLSLLKKYKLGVIGHTNFYLHWASPIKRLREASLQELTEHFALFNKLGANLVNIHPHWYQPNSSKKEIVKRIIQSLLELVDLARQHDIKLMLENQPNGFLNTPDSLMPIFNKVEGVLFHLDIGHVQVAGGGENLSKEFLLKLKGKLAHVHISDNKGNNDDHLPIGAGIVDWDTSIRQLKKIGYDKTITLEIFVKERHYLLYSREKIKKLWNRIE